MIAQWKQMAATAVLGIAVAFVVSGCGGGDTGASPAASPAPPPAATAQNINPMPRERLRDGGTVTLAVEQIPSTFNYNHVDGGLYDTANIVWALMPYMFGNDGAGVPIWNPDYLASEPAIAIGPKPVVTYEVNPQAAWDDGTPLTWQDFYWQWQALSGKNPAYRIVSSSGYEDIADVERGKDDREVVVTFERPYADWQKLFFPLYPASTNKDPQIFNEGWKGGALVTAGPFKLGSINATTKTLTLLRNEKWWGARPKLDAIVFRAMPVDAQIDALANGEIDAMDIGSDVSKYRRALAVPGIEMRISAGPNYRHLTFNGMSPSLSDVRVRRAIAMAIDRAAIARALLGPLGIEARPLDNHVFMANQEGYRDNAGEVGTYDPTKAAQLLDEAGWKLEGGVRKKDGMRLEISLVIPAGILASRQESELIQNMLGQVGVSLKIDTVPNDDFFDRYITPGQFDLTVFSWMGTPYPIADSRSLYGRPSLDAEGRLNVQQNYARIGSEELDDLLARAIAEFDRGKAEALANEADAMIWQEVHSLTLYQRPDLIAVKKDLANYGAFGIAQPWPYADMGWVAAAK
ncbi:MAG TPA: ABC transporter family substrate-binding protein [Gammaproteobacteria bacterium]|nr:ABC transporter family substrate-binding protein [Gammaproteobacteria bacterium]